MTDICVVNRLKLGILVMIFIFILSTISHSDEIGNEFLSPLVSSNMVNKELYEIEIPSNNAGDGNTGDERANGTEGLKKFNEDNTHKKGPLNAVEVNRDIRENAKEESASPIIQEDDYSNTNDALEKRNVISK